MGATSGYPTTQPYSRAGLLAKLTGAATLAVGAFLVGQGTSQLASTGSNLTWTANQLAGSGGSAPGTQGATAWALGGGTVRAGTQLRTDGTGADSITTMGGVTAPSGLYVNGTSGAIKSFCQIQRGGVTAWFMSVRDATDDLRFRAYDDAGVAIDYPLTIARAAGGAITLTRPLTATSIAMAGALSGVTTIIATGNITTAGGLIIGSGAANSQLSMDSADAGASELRWRKAGVMRWLWSCDGAESTGDSGSLLRLRARNDSGTAIDDPITIVRAAGGAIAVTRPLASSALIATTSSGAFGATAPLASERLLISGGGALPSVGATQVAVSNGGIACGAAVSAAGGFAATNTSSGVLGATIRNTNSGSAASANVIVENDLGSACRLNFGVQSSGYTSSLFGVTAANYTAIVTVGASTAGLMIGNASTGTPIIFGSANVEVARFTSGTLASGSLQIKYTGASALAVSGGATLAGTFVSTVSADSSHLCQVINQSSGTSALAGVEIQNNNGSNTRVRFQAYGSGLTATAFGITLGSYTSLVALGSNANGLIIGCQSIDKPVIIGINSSVAARFESSATADDTTLLLLDVTAGTVKRVSRGAADSSGAGYRALRIPN